MSTEIYIISGFLGSGKTTLIQKLLSEQFKDEKIALIENDFGDISVDAALLKSTGVKVKEINSGCICCSLSGDFVKACIGLIEEYKPDKIIIEPSGVGKLSDIIKAFEDPRIKNEVKIKSKITVVDVKRCRMYAENFGEFFLDQISYADAIALSHTEEFPDKVKEAHNLIRETNHYSSIISKPWKNMKALEILYPNRKNNTKIKEHTHDHDGHHHHSHSADEAFDTVTIQTNRMFLPDDLKKNILKLENNNYGNVIRLKGVVKGLNGYLNVQYIKGQVDVTKCDSKGDMLCIIGKNLKEEELHRILVGV